MSSASSSRSENSPSASDGPRYRQLLKVTDKALSTVEGSAGGTYFRSFLTGIELNATRPADDTIDIESIKRRGQKRRLSAVDKEQLDNVANALVGEVCEQVKDEFTKGVAASGVRKKLNTLDDLFNEQPILPGGNGERAPPPLSDNPEQILRAKRMRIKLQDKRNLERLLEEAQEVNKQLEADLDREKAIAKQCEEDLSERAAIVDKTYNIVMASNGNVEENNVSSAAEE